MKKISIIIFLVTLSLEATAEDWIQVADMSQVKWQMKPNGTVYFRNLNNFNSEALACCYNYYIDTTTEAGKSMWSVILAKMATSSELILGTPSISQPGPINYLGNW